jgi:hypothetical protein
MSTAIQILLKAREEMLARHQRELDELDASIDGLRQLETQGKDTSEKKAPLPVKRGQYQGMKAAIALQHLLSDRDGGPALIAQAAQDLRFAGAEPKWQEDRYERSLKITVSNNLRLFRYLDRDMQTTDSSDDAMYVELVARKKRYSS